MTVKTEETGDFGDLIDNFQRKCQDSQFTFITLRINLNTIYVFERKPQRKRVFDTCGLF